MTTLADGTLVIVNSLGMVHRIAGGMSCSAVAHARHREVIEPLQAKVHKLPCCDSCFRGRTKEYEHLINAAVTP